MVTLLAFGLRLRLLPLLALLPLLCPTTLAEDGADAAALLRL
jgi:hypothetical protein